MSQSSTLFIGIDVHKDSMAVAYVAQDHGAEVTCLVQSQARYSEMSYTIGHENTSLCPPLHRCRTACPPGGLTVRRCLCVATPPDPVGQRAWSARPGDCHRARRRRPARPHPITHPR